MSRARAGRGTDDDSLAVRAAWLHHTGGMTQGEVGTKLGVSPAKAHRLIATAMQRGAVRITVEGPMADCVELESRLVARFGLQECHVVPDLDEPGLPLRALGAEGARFLEREFEGRPGLVGIGHGRTLSAAVANLPRLDLSDERVVSLMGGLTRNYIATPHDVLYKLVERTGAMAYVLPVPFFANSAEDLKVLLAQRGVRQVVELGTRAALMFVGIGTTQPDAQLVGTGMIEPGEIEAVQRAGAVGEMLGHFFDREGRLVETALSARTLSPDFDTLRDRRIVTIAGGASKEAALRAVLRSGLPTGLITDERTAEAVLRDE